MASKYCHECIREKWKIDIKEVFSAWAFHKHEWSFFERSYTSYEAWRPTSHAQSEFYQWQSDEMAENSLHNFNSNLENYINPVDGIKTNLAPTCQSPTWEGRSHVQVETREKEIREERINQKTPTQDEFLLVPESDHISVEQIFERSLNRKKRKWGLRILKENSYRKALHRASFVWI